MTEPCGCPDREGHVDPCLDDDLGLSHGERSALNDDPLPHDVPGTQLHSWESPDAYCLCGHPNYLTCERAGELWELTLMRGPRWSA